jgi:lysophospholipase L1-like esterase
LLADLFPSVRARHVVKRRVLNKLTHTKDENTPSRNRFAQQIESRQTQINRGSVLLAPRAAGGRDRANEFGITTEVATRAEPTVDRGIAAFLDLARQHGIPVFVVVSPRRADAIAHSRKVGALDRQDRMLAACLERDPDVTILDARAARYGPEVFNDGTHLNREGAITWSADLGDAIAERLSGHSTKRWESLPDHRAVATRATPGEDSKRTQEWVRSESRARRR